MVEGRGGGGGGGGLAGRMGGGGGGGERGGCMYAMHAVTSNAQLQSERQAKCNIKMALIAAHLNAGVILVVTV